MPDVLCSSLVTYCQQTLASVIFTRDKTTAPSHSRFWSQQSGSPQGPASEPSALPCLICLGGGVQSQGHGEHTVEFSGH